MPTNYYLKLNFMGLLMYIRSVSNYTYRCYYHLHCFYNYLSVLLPYILLRFFIRILNSTLFCLVLRSQMPQGSSQVYLHLQLSLFFIFMLNLFQMLYSECHQGMLLRFLLEGLEY